MSCKLWPFFYSVQIYLANISLTRQINAWGLIVQSYKGRLGWTTNYPLEKHEKFLRTEALTYAKHSSCITAFYFVLFIPTRFVIGVLGWFHISCPYWDNNYEWWTVKLNFTGVTINQLLETLFIEICGLMTLIKAEVFLCSENYSMSRVIQVF